ncbi:VOC family protein [Flaviflagellibacter deserti]|uniref:VOC family protein n=1 Tax=Flaviflagellibacter deserti TaxID=2267266 RepID=A0ABV9Z9V2_9HYPH
MAIKDGTFIWHELMTTDTAAAQKFYGDVVGWTFKSPPPGMGMPDVPYTLISTNGQDVGGMMAQSDTCGGGEAKPGWLGSVKVDDVDATAAKVKDLGGMIYYEPTDIPGVGRFAIAGDPGGGTICLLKIDGMPDKDPDPNGQMAIGHTGWNELHSTDWEKSFGFFQKMFGWTKSTAMDMGPMGTYQLFATDGKTGDDARAVGGMMTKMPEIPMPGWLFYFNVDAIDAAIDRVKAGGGEVLMGPHEVPGGAWIIQGRDPQGAMFALVSTKR